MNEFSISRNVVKDLLPAYLAGTASEETRKLVDRFIQAHPEFLNELDNRLGDVLSSNGNGRLELMSLMKAKRLIKGRSMFMGSAIFFSLLPFSFKFDDGHFQWLLGGEPAALVFCAVMALGFWTGYAIMYRRLKTTGIV